MEGRLELPAFSPLPQQRNFIRILFFKRNVILQKKGNNALET